MLLYVQGYGKRRKNYEIEFYKDRMEYSYEIDAIIGEILDYEKDND